MRFGVFKVWWLQKETAFMFAVGCFVFYVVDVDFRAERVPFQRPDARLSPVKGLDASRVRMCLPVAGVSVGVNPMFLTVR